MPMSSFTCPICRVIWTRPKPYLKGQSNICENCRAILDAADENDTGMIHGPFMDGTKLRIGQCLYCAYVGTSRADIDAHIDACEGFATFRRIELINAYSLWRK